MPGGFGGGDPRTPSLVFRAALDHTTGAHGGDRSSKFDVCRRGNVNDSRFPVVRTADRPTR